MKLQPWSDYLLNKALPFQAVPQLSLVSRKQDCSQHQCLILQGVGSGIRACSTHLITCLLLQNSETPSMSSLWSGGLRALSFLLIGSQKFTPIMFIAFEANHCELEQDNSSYTPSVLFCLFLPLLLEPCFWNW